MKTMHRQFGRLKTRSTDDSDVAVLLRDFNEADNLTSKFIESTTQWRDAWSGILNHQDRLVGEFELMYTPIIGAGASSGPEPAPTPEDIMARTIKLHEDYSELRQDLTGELSAVDDSMIRPAMAVKDYLAPMRRTIKKRDDRKLDYERFQSKYDGFANKAKRSDRDNIAMAKAETDLATVKDIYNNADETLRDRLPHLLAAIYSLLPHLLTTQIELQNTMLANYYTILHNFAQDYRFPSPPPPMEHIIIEWEESLLPVRDEIESFRCLANGKAIHQKPSQSQEQTSPRTSQSNTRPPSRASSYTEFSGRRSSTDTHYTAPSISPSSPETETKPPPVMSTKPRIPSASSSTLTVPTVNSFPPKSPPSPTPSLRGSSPTPPNPYPPSATPMTSGFSPAGPRTADSFSSAQRSRQPSYTPSIASAASTPSIDPQQTSSVAMAAAAAGKKKRPPPPPKPKSISSEPPALFVTALYDFGGQGSGDLVFNEGDRIRVVHKTGSTDDWWEGELRGIQGNFPANYVE